MRRDVEGLSVFVMERECKCEEREMHDYIGIEYEERHTEYPRCTSMRIPCIPPLRDYSDEEDDGHDTILEDDIDKDIVRRVDDTPLWEVGTHCSGSRCREELEYCFRSISCDE
jgi:hypothetical protein